MKNKIFIGALILSALAILWGAGAGSVSAQGPVNADVWKAAYLLDTKLETIPAMTALWYRFDYGGDRSSIFLTLPDGNKTGLEFRLYTPEQIARFMFDPSDESFVARGTAALIPCDDGKCKSNDLTWVGGFPVGGTYYIKVINPNAQAITFRFLIQGTNIILGPPAGVELPAPTTVPTTTVVTTGTTSAVPTTTVVTTGTTSAVPTPAPSSVVVIVAPTTPQNDSPFTAVSIRDNTELPISGNTSLWYRFDYSGDRSDIDLTSIYGNKTGVQFTVYTADRAMDFILRQVDSPVGRGNPSSTSPDDLVWHGSFSEGGRFYVQVTNPSPKPMTFRLMIRGSSITIE